MRARISFVMFFVFLLLPVLSQEKDSYFFIGSQAHYGFIIPHTAAIEPLSHTNPSGFDLSLNWFHTSKQSWDVFHRYNISGIQAGYFNYQNPEVVGSSYVLTVFTEPVLINRNRFIFSLKAGGGFSWQTRIFDFETDTLNKFFSTRISFPLYLSARLKYRLAEKTFITLSGNYNHISNGAMKVPNMGINFPTLSLGLEYFPGTVPLLNNGYQPGKRMKLSENFMLIQVLAGYKVVYGEPVSAYGVNISFNKQLRSYYALGGGVEMINDGGVRKMIQIDEKDIDYKRVALTGRQSFFLGKVSFSQSLGLYIYSPYKAKAPVYQKYELTYPVLREFSLGVFLKAHTSDAELFGFLATYRFRL